MTTTAVETKSGRIARISNSLIGVSSRCQEYPSETALMITTAEHRLADIRELAPVIAERATEIEAGGRIPPDLVEALRSIGVFRMLVPHSHGGLELDLPKALEIYEALSRIDGSVGWVAMIGGGCDLFAPLLPRHTYEQVYQNGPDGIISGSAPPARTAEAGPPPRPGERRGAVGPGPAAVPTG